MLKTQMCLMVILKLLRLDLSHQLLALHSQLPSQLPPLPTAMVCRCLCNCLDRTLSINFPSPILSSSKQSSALIYTELSLTLFHTPAANGIIVCDSRPATRICSCPGAIGLTLCCSKNYSDCTSKSNFINCKIVFCTEIIKHLPVFRM